LIIKKEEVGNRIPFEVPQKTPHTWSAKSVTLVAKLDLEGDTTIGSMKHWDHSLKYTLINVQLCKAS
jgi:hypothetical protein